MRIYPSFVDGAQQLQSEFFTATGGTNCSHDIEYAYDALGRASTRTISGSGPETYQYDAIGRLTEHASDLGAFQLSYLGQTPQMTERQLLPVTANLKTQWSYLDNAHDRRLSGIANTGLSASQFTNFTFETSPENSITSIAQSSDATVAIPDPSLQTVAYNNLNEITTVGPQSYSYDANGNLTSDGSRTYSWDAENRLVSIAYPAEPGKLTQFTYDGLGRRVEIDDTPTGGGAATIAKYVWCGSQLCQRRDGAYATSRGYFDEGEFKTSGTNPALYYGIDQIGSVRRVFESIGSAPTYDYDPWGMALQGTSALSDTGYAGMIAHDISSLNLTWYRNYDQSIGRWLSRDKAQNIYNQNSYNYADENPITLSDPLGLWTIQFGVSAGYSKAGGSGTAFAGLAFDTNGSAAFYWGTGVGVSSGFGASAGFQTAVSNAECVDYLKGVFGNFSSGGGYGENISGDAFIGHDPNGKRIVGGGLSYGIGAGRSSSVSYTDTGIYH